MVPSTHWWVYKLNGLEVGSLFRNSRKLRTHLWDVVGIRCQSHRIQNPEFPRRQASNIPVRDCLDWRATLIVGETILWVGNPRFEKVEKMRWVPTCRHPLLSLADHESHVTGCYTIPLLGLSTLALDWESKEIISPLSYFCQSTLSQWQEKKLKGHILSIPSPNIFLSPLPLSSPPFSPLTPSCLPWSEHLGPVTCSVPTSLT